MKHIHKAILWTLSLALLLLPQLALAESLGQQAVTAEPIECEYITLDEVMIARTEDNLLMRIQYTFHQDLTAQELADLEIISFYLMDDETTTEFPDTFVSGHVGSLDGSLEFMPAAGATLVSYDTLAAVDTLPETVYLRPYYKFMGTWGAPIVLNLQELGITEITDPAVLDAFA